MPRQQQFICGLSHEVTIAVLPRLNMEELMFELNRRIQNLDEENSIKDRLVSILRDVMLEEYRQLEMTSQLSSPDETTVIVPVPNHESVLSAYAETMLSVTSRPDVSQQSSGLDIVIKKENDTSDLLIHTKEPDTNIDVFLYTKEPEFGTEKVQLTVSQDQHCDTPSPGSPTLPPCNAPLMQINSRDDSRIKEEDFGMTNEETRTCHDELNIDTPSFNTQVQHNLNSMDTETPLESYAPCEETPFAPFHLPPNQGNVHIKAECHVFHDGQIGQTSQTGFINRGHEQSANNCSEETLLTSSQPAPGKVCENMGSLRPDDDSQIGSKCSAKHRKRHKEERPFLCGQCGYRARQKCRLVEHMRKHTGEKPFKCNHCNYKTSFKQGLICHVKKHTDAEPYRCNICDYKTYVKSNIDRHLMRHAGVKPYKCEECDYRTTQNIYLTRHRRCHTGERPYSCQECDYRASEKCTLAKHMRRKQL